MQRKVALDAKRKKGGSSCLAATVAVALFPPLELAVLELRVVEVEGN